MEKVYQLGPQIPKFDVEELNKGALFAMKMILKALNDRDETMLKKMSHKNSKPEMLQVKYVAKARFSC